MATPKTDLNFLDIIDICDKVHLRRNKTGVYDTLHPDEFLVPLCLNESPEYPVVGLLRPIVVEQLRLENERNKQNGLPEIWTLRLDESECSQLTSGCPGPRVSFHHSIDNHTKRTAVVKKLCERWRDTGAFPDLCGPTKWRSESYPVYINPFGVHDHPDHGGKEEDMNFAFEMERSACSLFGVVVYGVHMNIYEERTSVDGRNGICIWVPTRASTKPTWPGYLDNSVAGGIPSGMPAFESMIKECMEEASIGEDVVRKYAKAVGAVSYFFRNSGFLQPEVQFVYDMCIPSDVAVTPVPFDGEVESFELVPQDKLVQLLRSGLFKPNCAIVIIDFLIRLGYITPDNEPNFLKIITRIHGNFNYDSW